MDQFTFRNAIGNALNARQYWQPNTYQQLYGNRPAQFADINSQIGASMNANISPQPFVPSWAVQNLPARLAGYGYLNGGPPSHYGSMFSKWDGPTGSRQIGNPYPGNGYNLTNMMMYPQQLQGAGLYPQNPFLQGVPTPMGPQYQYQTPTAPPQQPPDTTNPGTTNPGTTTPGTEPGSNQGQITPPPTAGGIAPPPYAQTSLMPDRYSSEDAYRKSMMAPPNPYGEGSDYKLETAPNTTDPGSMSGLYAFLGGQTGDALKQQQQAYQTWYQQQYGNQAPGGGTAYWPK